MRGYYECMLAMQVGKKQKERFNRKFQDTSGMITFPFDGIIVFQPFGFSNSENWRETQKIAVEAYGEDNVNRFIDACVDQWIADHDVIYFELNNWMPERDYPDCTP